MEDLNQCIQKTAELTQRICGLAAVDGVVLMCSDDSLVHSEDQEAEELLREQADFQVGSSRSYRAVVDSNGNRYAVFIEGTEESLQPSLGLFACWAEELMRDGGAELNRETFLKNVLLENELPGDIPLKCREYHIPMTVRRTCLLIHLNGEQPVECLAVLKDLIPNRRADYILTLDESDWVILKETGEDPQNEMLVLAERILYALHRAGCRDITLGIGLPTESMRDLAKSYREASLALTVGRIFEPDQTIIQYDRLGLGRLIYQLPMTLCQMFLEEVFPAEAYEMLDTETLTTIDKFFENNLNGSETARQLFVHRNTLVYRLDKVMKITGLDLRSFDDAVLFKLASMVRKYMDYHKARSPRIEGDLLPLDVKI